MYKILLNKIHLENILHSVMLELTYDCNLDCFFCYNPKNVLAKPLQFRQYETLFDDLARMQVLFLTLTGGEPLVHPQFFEIAKAARQSGFAIRIKSNGHLIHGERARRLKKEINPLAVEVSLHGATPEVHERQTRLPGSFKQLIENVKYMQNIELRPSFVSTLTAWNENQIEDMFHLADQLNVQLRFQGPVAPRGGANCEEDWQTIAIQATSDGWKRLNNICKCRKNKHGVQPLRRDCLADTDSTADTNRTWCGAGSQEIIIDPFGNVSPCVHLRWTAGNLHEQTIEEIWQHGEAFIRARSLSRKTARQMKGKKPLQLGAPLFCPGLDLLGCDNSTR